MVTDPGTREAAQVLAQQASQAAAAAVARIARRTGSELTPVPAAAAHPQAPADALRIARQLEHAARAEVRVHVRRAREAGLSWHEVGALLGFGDLPAGIGPTVAEMAFDYTTGPRTVHAWFPAPPVFRWDCLGCGQAIADHGPARGPGCDQDGHTDGCQRLAAEAADWEMERSALP